MYSHTSKILYSVFACDQCYVQQAFDHELGVKPQTVLMWSTFVRDCFIKTFGVKPYMIESIKKTTKAIMHVIKNEESEQMLLVVVNYSTHRTILCNNHNILIRQISC